MVGLACTYARSADSISLIDRQALPAAPAGAASAGKLRLTAVYLKDTGWTRDEIVPAVAQAATILAQCGLRLAEAELLLVEAPARYRDFFTPASRELARALPLPKPAVYFVAGTRQDPAFDAEAIGRGNSRGRPELAGTVWVTRGARDLGIVLAHELAHVLMDSGEHSSAANNLMRDETAPANTRLTNVQCASLSEEGLANRLLRQ